MTTWTRAAQQTLCGGLCRGFIAKGAPLLVIELAGVRRPRFRCEACAALNGLKPPLELPMLTEVKRVDWTPEPMPSMQQIAGAARMANPKILDWKQQQAGR